MSSEDKKMESNFWSFNAKLPLPYPSTLSCSSDKQPKYQNIPSYDVSSALYTLLSLLQLFMFTQPVGKLESRQDNYHAEDS